MFETVGELHLSMLVDYVRSDEILLSKILKVIRIYRIIHTQCN